MDELFVLYETYTWYALSVLSGRFGGHGRYRKFNRRGRDYGNELRNLSNVLQCQQNKGDGYLVDWMRINNKYYAKSHNLSLGQKKTIHVTRQDPDNDKPQFSAITEASKWIIKLMITTFDIIFLNGIGHIKDEYSRTITKSGGVGIHLIKIGRE